MTVEFSFFDPVLDGSGLPDRVYNAQQFTNYFKTLVTTGIMRQHENEMLVSADGTTMQTSIGKGTCFIEGRQMIVTAPHLMLHDTESVGLKRIDRIVARLDLRVEARHVMPFIKKGVAAANPVAPNLQRDSEVYEISLASVTVTGGRSYLTASDIVDERANPSLCGWASSDIFPNYNDDTLQAVLVEVQANDTRIANHEKNAVNHVAYGVATGTNAKSVTVDIQFVNYLDGVAIAFKNSSENTGEVTLNVNGKGAKPIVKANGDKLVVGDLKANAIYTVRYNASTGNFYLQGEGGDISIGELSSDVSTQYYGRNVGSILLQRFSGGFRPHNPVQNDNWEFVNEFKINRRGGIEIEFFYNGRYNLTGGKGFKLSVNDVEVVSWDKPYNVNGTKFFKIDNLNLGDVIKVEAGWNIEITQINFWTKTVPPTNLISRL